MTTQAALLASVRAYIREPVQKNFTDAQLSAWLDSAQALVTAETNCILDLASDVTVAYQRDYALPSLISARNKITSVRWSQRYELEYKNPDEFFRLGRDSSYQQSIPLIYTVQDNRIHIWPIPSTTAQATTLTAAIAAAGTTSCTVAAVSIFPFTTGRIKIETEIMEFRAKDTTTLILSNMRRGLEGTTAAAHGNGLAVTYMDLEFWHYRKPRTLGASQDTEIPAVFDPALAYYAAAQAFMCRDGSKAEADKHMAMWREELARARQQLRADSADTYASPAPSSDYAAGDME